MAKTESRVQLKQGDLAPAFSLLGIDGRTYTLEDFKGKHGSLIIFMCNHCPYVKARMGEVVALHKEFGDRVAVVGINSSDPDYPGEGVANMKAFAAERRLAFPYLLDEDGAVAKAYGATCTPDPFLFDKDMKLAFHGRISDALEPSDTPTEFTMKENIQKLVRGEPIEPWFNPSLGCSIKFKN
ncbi:alkyl hydroperoxide reductase [Candidatus Kaiserbacteria bacterium RIFCSPHIGHO2_01_FULL_55_17]|uniref:Alkyl hydroperoxide reductase n=1 Tax=Candidatus Kaiserbacteria bacterium RIFCSPHIGHO2_01_FULL_55_17 TaxID=1798484 RepID=A0A1F6D8E2_9BACT|nr:MAG: alkyl hydroperoxide reductase [Candidatus Kaiserbacteria bacterium RIFCSPHIGHO2_01_FULL_55_17]